MAHGHAQFFTAPGTHAGPKSDPIAKSDTGPKSHTIAESDTILEPNTDRQPGANLQHDAITGPNTEVVLASGSRSQCLTLRDQRYG